MDADSGRSERIVWREDEGAPVLPTGIGGVRGASDYVMPIEDVALFRMSTDQRDWTLLDVLCVPVSNHQNMD